jgi:hypothetical protein
VNIPHPKNDDLDAFQDQMHDAIKAASPTEISNAVVEAAQFIEDLFDKVPSSMFPDAESYTHLNNATATICRGVNELADRRA